MAAETNKASMVEDRGSAAMALAKDDPRNADVLVKRRDELLALASKAGINSNAPLENAGDDTVAQIGILAKLLGIDAMIALDASSSLTEVSALSQVFGSSQGEQGA
jgi:hypothetical protein